MTKNIILLGDSFTFGHGCSDRIYHWDPKLKKYVGDVHSLAQGPSQFCWGRLIEKEFSGVRVYNLAYPGKDNISCFADLLLARQEHYEDLKIDAVFFNMTYDDRQQIADSVGFASSNFAEKTQGRDVDYFRDYVPLNSWSPLWNLDGWAMDRNEPKEYVRALEYYANYLFSPAWGAKLSHNSLYAVESWARKQGAKFYWSASRIVSVNTSTYIDAGIKKKQLPNIVDHLKIHGKPKEVNLEYRSSDGHANDAGHQRYYQDIIRPIIDGEIK